WIERGWMLPSALSLAASVAIKYVTAPFAILHLARAWIERGRGKRRWALTMLAGAGAGVAIFLIFYRSPAFFATTHEMRSRLFFTPSSILARLAAWQGVPIGPLPRLLDWAILLAPLLTLIQYLRHPSES